MIQRLRSMLLALALSTGVATAFVAGFVDTAAAEPSARDVSIVVDDGSYSPAKIEMKEGERVRLAFLRKEHNPCTREVVISALGVRRELPTDQPVTIDISALKAGTYDFHCGMNMLTGQIVVGPTS